MDEFTTMNVGVAMNRMAGSAKAPPPAAPQALSSKADSILSTARSLLDRLTCIDDRLFGPGPQPVNGASDKEALPPALEQTLDRITAALRNANVVAEKLAARL
jgi:hypothetical protein